MNDWISEKQNTLREFFELDDKSELISREAVERFDVPANVAEHLRKFNIEWHIVPPAELTRKIIESGFIR